LPRRQRNEPIALAAEEWIGADDERVHSLLGQDCEGRVQIVFAVCTEHFELLSDRARHLLRGFRLGLGIGISRIDEKADHGGVGDQLALRPQRLRKRSSSRNAGADVYATTLRSIPKCLGSNLPPIREDRSTLPIENQSFVSSGEGVFIPAFSFPGFDSIPGVILAKHRPKFPTALRGLLAKPLLKQDR
jgi:hypothetical protein